ncbi:MAG: zinc metallopeptidase [Clostridia bacterium]|nr:zinc metallopeptidase [Clostridia bacterium]
MYYDLTYLIFMLPAIILSMWAQFKVKSSYNKYSKIPNSRGMTGETAARAVLGCHGITNVRIEHVAGSLTDHFSPKENIIRLSDGVYSQVSIAAVCIAAHEAGHAVQHAEGYVPNKIRSSIIPVASITSKLSMPILIAGFLFSDTLIRVGIIAYSLAVLVYLVTLPVEFDASRRALSAIKSNYMLDENEYKGAKSVLTAAAMTYVASALSALIQFLRLVLIANGRRRD